MLLNVRRAAKRAQGGEKIIGPTKTHATRRLSIDDVTLAVIDEHRARAAEWAEAAGVEADGRFRTDLGPLRSRGR